MGRFQSVLVAAAAAIGFSSVASAADIPVKAHPITPPIAYSWTGWYVGASAGYASGQVVNGVPSFPASANIKPSGFVGTVLGGYDYQFANNIVLGARLAVPILSISDSTPSGAVTFQGKVKSAVVVAGRLGYAMGNVLPYFVGGGVWGRGEGTVIGIGTANANHTGYLLGGGVEYMFLPHWSVDANYTYISLGNSTYNFTPFGGLAVQEGFRSNNFTVGVNYRF